MPERSSVSGGLYLPFVVGMKTYAISDNQISRVALPSGMALVGHYPNLPSYVVGVLANAAEILTVVDMGLLLGLSPVQNTVKTRLLMTSEGALKGIALLVSRALDLTQAEDIHSNATIQIISSTDISRALAKQTKTMESPSK